MRLQDRFTSSASSSTLKTANILYPKRWKNVNTQPTDELTLWSRLSCGTNSISATPQIFFFWTRHFIAVVTKPSTWPYHAPDQSSPRLENRFKIHFNITLPPTPRLSMWYLAARFPHQNSVCISPAHHAHHISFPLTWSPFLLNYRFTENNNKIRGTSLVLQILCCLCYTLYLFQMTPNAINSSWVAYALTCWHTMRMRQLLVSHAAMSRSVVCDSSAVGFLHDTYANSSCHNKCYTLILKRPHTPVPRRKAIYKYVKRFRTTSSILYNTKKM